jgi:predicted DNA-binding transcriptional regulator YafY
MRRADRLIELVALLRSKPIVRADDLATALEVTPRTVYRDIAALQAQGLPIEGVAGVGYAVRGKLDLAPLTFGHDELEALALGLAYVEQVGDTALAAAARAAHAKIEIAWIGVAPNGVLNRPLRASQLPERRLAKHGELLRNALRKKSEIAFRYEDRAGTVTDRLVQPLALWAFSDGWLLVAWCTTRRDFRVFRVDRMRRVTTGSEFQEDEEQSFAAYLRQRHPPKKKGAGGRALNARAPAP